MAKKLQSSLAVEGELPEDGLAAYGDDGDDLMMALARKIVSGEEQDDAETVEAVFAQRGTPRPSPRSYLVDDGWKAVEVEPTEAARGQRQRSRRQRRRAERRAGHGQRAPRQRQRGGPVGCTRSTATAASSEAAEPQQSLFSWAEFMAEEPVKPKARKSKPQPASMSMFEWALELEQEREKETVGAGR